MLPLEHMRQLCNEGVIGGLVPMVVSFSGFLPHAIRLVKELVPSILQVAKEHNAHAAMIIPAGKLCIQSAGLVARALEVNNIATTMTTWDPDMAFLTAPPRLTSTYLPPSSPLGMPGNAAQQRKVLTATLQLLELNAPTGIVYLNESGAI